MHQNLLQVDKNFVPFQSNQCIPENIHSSPRLLSKYFILVCRLGSTSNGILFLSSMICFAWLCMSYGCAATSLSIERLEEVSSWTANTWTFSPDCSFQKLKAHSITWFSCSVKMLELNAIYRQWGFHIWSYRHILFLKWMRGVDFPTICWAKAFTSKSYLVKQSEPKTSIVKSCKEELCTKLKRSKIGNMHKSSIKT